MSRDWSRPPEMTEGERERCEHAAVRASGISLPPRDMYRRSKSMKEKAIHGAAEQARADLWERVRPVVEVLELVAIPDGTSRVELAHHARQALAALYKETE